MSMNFNKTVLVIHAHPDDTEAFCAGTLQLLKNAGYKIVIATMTAGGMGGINSTEQSTITTRKEEARKAAEVLDADYYCFDQRDGFVFDNEAVRLKVISLIRKVKAGIVMTHLPNDYHSDHRVTATIVDAAAMISALPNVPVEEEPLEVTPLFYHTPPLGFSDPLGEAIAPPHFFVDISTVIDTKMEMLKFHESQIELMRVMHKMDNFFDVAKEYNQELGQMVGVNYAECLWQHLGGGFQKEPQLQKDLEGFILKNKEI